MKWNISRIWQRLNALLSSLQKTGARVHPCCVILSEAKNLSPCRG